MSRVLLVSPAFHGYWRSIAAALEQCGHQVEAHRYDELAGGGAKVYNKVRYELGERLALGGAAAQARDFSARAAQAVTRADPEAVVVVKGDVLGDDFLESLGARPRVLWLYDELRRTRWTIERLRAFGPIASYSPQDVADLDEAGIAATHLPLAYDPAVPFTPRVTPEAVFVGARYPNRERLLVGVQLLGAPVRAYGKTWSNHPFDRLRTWRLTGASLPVGREVSLADAYGLMAGAPAALNIHGDQDGFTMRTFEAGGVGAVQLIDRADVDRHYDPDSEVACFDGADDLAELIQRARTDRRWADGLRARSRKRTLAEHTFVHRTRVLEALWRA